jgi:hypothetical protein
MSFLMSCITGRVEIGYYCVTDGHVVLTDENGKPTGEDKRYLNPGGDAKLIACAMLRARRRNSAAVSGFSDRISYPKLKF